MDYLWTPWRYSYVTEPKGDPRDRGQCAFCRILESGRGDSDSLIVFRGERNFVMLNRYPYTSGHMMVIPYAHLASLGEAPLETAEEMMRLTRRLERLLRRLYRPDGLNVGMNIGRAAGAGVAGHIHMHALPRWAGDSSFASVIGETRVLPEALSVTCERARAEFERGPA
jgi:ATP adenylyltransferase